LRVFLNITYKRIETEQTTKQTVDEATTVRTTETSRQYSSTIIPFGKSKYSVTVTVPADVDITHARFVDTIIQLK
jgi:hypothetical protein